MSNVLNLADFVVAHVENHEVGQIIEVLNFAEAVGRQIQLAKLRE